MICLSRAMRATLSSSGGPGVSRHRAGLPDFLKLGGDVIDLLGAGERSLARKLFRRIKDLDPVPARVDDSQSRTGTRC
jgi:hypothetical protein